MALTFHNFVLVRFWLILFACFKVHLIKFAANLLILELDKVSLIHK